MVVVFHFRKLFLHHNSCLFLYSVCLRKKIVDEWGSMSDQQRRIALHPTRPIQIGETMPFATKPQCSFREFVVKKRFLPGKASPSYFYFYAVSRAANGFKELAGGTETHKYQHQLAYITCLHGWITQLTVFDKSLGMKYEGPMKFYGNEDPRGCGIGIVLTELCLIDPEVNNMKLDKDKRGNEIGNKALRILKQDMKERTNKNCYKLVGLTMAANPKQAGHVYFSAAINMDYNKMVVVLDRGWEKTNVKYNIYDTRVAKQNYKPNGDIDSCCGYEKCHAYSRSWIFCADSSDVQNSLLA